MDTKLHDETTERKCRESAPKARAGDITELFSSGGSQAGKSFAVAKAT